MTTKTTTTLPKIVSREEWRAARDRLLIREKQLTRQRDALNAERRRLPVVEIDQSYTFNGPQGKVKLQDLFEGRRQLIVYHFMFEPGPPPPGESGEPWDEGCSGCSFVADNIGNLTHLHARDTTLVLVSRAPWSKIQPFQKRMGWTVPWYSSYGSQFNFDFGATAVKEVDGKRQEREQPGLSVFLCDGDRVLHSYSTFARGLEPLDGTYQYLDLTPFGRQEDWEDSPEGWPQTPTYGWLRHHDKYDPAVVGTGTCCHS